MSRLVLRQGCIFIGEGERTRFDSFLLLILISSHRECCLAAKHLVCKETVKVEVDRLVVGLPEEHLGDLIRLTTSKHRIGLLLLEQALLRQTEVRQASVSTLVDQHVFGFNIPVHDTVPMDLLDGENELGQVNPGMRLR